MKEKFDLRTLEGSKRIFRISVVAVILFSFFAYMFACNWGRVKISELNIDSRGSVMQATMYTPTNTNSESSVRDLYPRIELQPQYRKPLCGRTCQKRFRRAQRFYLRLRRVRNFRYE